jgi:HEAT repeat protein
MQQDEQLLAQLRNSEPSIRAESAWILGEAGDPIAMEPLLNTLRHDPSTEVRALAARGLGTIGESGAIPALLAAFSDDWAVADRAATALVNLGEASVVPMLGAFADPNSLGRGYAAWVLGRLHAARATELLIEGLRDENQDVRRCCVQALGELGDSRATRPLIACLHDEHWYVRSCAAAALDQIGGPEAVAALVASLQSSDQFVWSEAAWAVARHQGAGAVDMLITLFARVPTPDVGHPLASAVASIGDAAVEPLLGALDDPDANVRYWAIKALTALSCEAALPRLHWMAEHDLGETPSRAQVRAAARRGIKRIAKRQTEDDSGG